MNVVTPLHELPDRIFYCLRGARGHAWDERELGRRTEWGMPLSYLCTRCEKVRHDIYDSNGNLSYRSYDVPAWHPDIAAHDTNDVRREVLRRARARARSRRALHAV